MVEQPIIPETDVPDAGAVSAEFFGRQVLVTREPGRPTAYVNVCPHLGGPLELEQDAFVCQWHGARFGLNGRCLQGPARPDSRLMILPTRVVDGVVTYMYDPPERDS